MSGGKVRRPTFSGAMEAEVHVDTIELLNGPLQKKGPNIPAEVGGPKPAMELAKGLAAGLEEFLAPFIKAKRELQEKVSPRARDVSRPVKVRTESMANDQETVLDLVEEMLRNMLDFEGLQEAKLEEGDTSDQLMVRLGEVRFPLRKAATLALEALNEKNYRVPASDASRKRRIDQRGGILFQMLMPYFSAVNQAETDAAVQIGREIVEMQLGTTASPEKAVKLKSVEDAIRTRMSAVGSPRVEKIIVDGQASEIYTLEDGPIGKDLYLLSLSRMRTIEGQEVADHLRVIVTVSPKGIDLWPVGIGESKFKSGVYDLVPQILKTFQRLRPGLRAANIPENLPVNVRWGSKLAVIIQSEEQIPESHLEGLEAQIRKAARAPKLKPKVVPIAQQKEAQAARDVIEALVDGAIALWNKNKQD